MFQSLYHPFVFLPHIGYAPRGYTPKDLSVPFDEVVITADDGVRLSAWWMRAAHPRGCLLYLHGNGGRLADWAPHAAEFVELGMNVLLLDYRGYGASQGRPSEKGMFLDGEAAWRWIRAQAESFGLPAMALGKSLGTSIAAHVAAAAGDSMGALLLDSPFTSMRETIGHHAWWLPRFMIPRFFETESFAVNVRCPTLIVHGVRDGIVPIKFARRLFDSLRCRKELVEVPDATHNGIAQRDEYWAALRRFLFESGV